MAQSYELGSFNEPEEEEKPNYGSGYLEKILGEGGLERFNTDVQRQEIPTPTPTPAPASLPPEALTPTKTKVTSSRQTTTPVGYAEKMDWLSKLMGETSDQEKIAREAQQRATQMQSIAGLADPLSEIPLQFGGIMTNQQPTKVAPLADTMAAPAKAEAAMEQQKYQDLLDKYKTTVGLKLGEEKNKTELSQQAEVARHNRALEGIARDKPTLAGKETEAQARSKAFANSAEQANVELNRLAKDGFNREELGPSLREGAAKWTGWAGGGAIRSSEGKQWNASQWKFLNAIMRDESGAAIPDSEYPKYIPIFFPQFNDDEATVSLKAKYREQAIQNLRSKGKQPNSFDKFPTPENLNYGLDGGPGASGVDTDPDQQKTVVNTVTGTDRSTGRKVEKVIYSDGTYDIK
jgi:hypothetical protein